MMIGDENMGKFMLKRIIRGIFTFFIAITITFVILRCIPSSPVSIMLDGTGMTQESIDKITKDFALDQPYHIQYVRYISNLFKGDLGLSFSTKEPVLDILLQRLPWTLLLVILVQINCLLNGIPLGVATAKRYGSLFDVVVNIFAIIGSSIFVPSFGVALLCIFGVKFPIFPIGGSHAPGLKGIRYFFDVCWHMILPVVTLTFVNLASYVLLMRSSMIDVMKKDYIRTAYSKGMVENRVIWVHGVRNALIPTVTVSSSQASALIGGSVLTETVFSYPGVGRLIYEAVSKLDYPVIQGAFLVLSIIVICINIITDLIYLKLNPTIKFS